QAAGLPALPLDEARELRVVGEDGLARRAAAVTTALGDVDDEQRQRRPDRSVQERSAVAAVATGNESCLGNPTSRDEEVGRGRVVRADARALLHLGSRARDRRQGA